VSTNWYSQCVGNGVRSTWATITFLGEQRVTIDPEAAILVRQQMTEMPRFCPTAAGRRTIGSCPPPSRICSLHPQSLHEHLCHALIEARLLAADRLANEGDGHKDFPSRNFIARVPAVYRSGEERFERRFEPVQEVLREVIVGRVAGVKRRGEPAFGADEVRETLDPTYERIPWIDPGPE